MNASGGCVSATIALPIPSARHKQKIIPSAYVFRSFKNAAPPKSAVSISIKTTGSQLKTKSERNKIPLANPATTTIKVVTRLIVA